jgi:hypothetical protein
VEPAVCVSPKAFVGGPRRHDGSRDWEDCLSRLQFHMKFSEDIIYEQLFTLPRRFEFICLRAGSGVMLD